MKILPQKTVLTAFGVLTLLATPASAQLLGGVANGAGQAQAQAQQRVQAQVQQRVQAQVQQRAQAQVQQRAQAQVQAQVQAQLQTRVQAEAARAANIAVRAAAAAQQQATATAQSQAAAARQRAASGVNVRLATSTRVNSGTRVGGQNVNANANAYARLGIDTALDLPPGITKTDVEIYDNIFGRFNPLRAQPTETSATSVTPVSQSQPAPGDTTSSPDGNTQEPADERRDRRATTDLLASVQSDASLTSRIGVAARQRRAEISRMRDQALATSDTTLMLKAQHMDDSLKAFVDAHTTASARAGAAGANRLRNSVPQGQSQQNVQGSGAGAGNASGAAAAAASGSAAGSSNLNTDR